MIGHAVDLCPDDPEVLRTRLDELTDAGARIVSVVWHPERVVEGQEGAYDAKGGYIIVSQHGG